ncbi:toluene tolerance protein [Candidatus Kinetoplastibacterium blastocrithidii TCC012E]|uniref:Toluene tolerance protein n=1 Tax=Candidatus Kinetoplastidibacterium blastocrithidiae TCC012E TaxID=1208922 RepID=M1LZI8_9PROT|nr:ABC transporter substrate-binding protein [Candidatus Kinetoplastibacterium blastocrithidii]AFZ83383.1 toluene tolerance protein [Candidatus Kinetoplastibacterium blastocrithidii (ex Strigomonas culicis)]AGF49481.1 toluene tolerance protein [Candidatus Kinetoplastibacterium blastocrithidii TCC012E]
MYISLGNDIKKTVFFLYLISVMLFPNTTYAQAGNVNNPDNFITNVTNLALIEIQKTIESGRMDLDSINVVVDNYILPHVDFFKTTKLTAGKHWKIATDEQRKALIKVFRNTLVKTYRSAFSLISKNTKIKVLPYRGEAKSNDAIIKSFVQQSNGKQIQINYRLTRHGNTWKIYDVSIEGMWLIESYRNQFNNEIHSNGIDTLIEKLDKIHK